MLYRLRQLHNQFSDNRLFGILACRKEDSDSEFDRACRKLCVLRVVELVVSFSNRWVFGCQFHWCFANRKVEMQADETFAFRFLLRNFVGDSLRFQVLQFLRGKSCRGIECNRFAR